MLTAEKGLKPKMVFYASHVEITAVNSAPVVGLNAGVGVGMWLQLKLEISHWCGLTCGMGCELLWPSSITNLNLDGHLDSISDKEGSKMWMIKFRSRLLMTC